MLIFSTIAAIISPFVYLLPFIILWIKGEDKYVLRKTDKVIKNKYIFIAKVTLLIIMSIAFVFTWPTKVMFYPLKVCVFIAILIAIQLITDYLFLEDNDVSKLDNKTWNIILICWLLLCIAAAISGFFAGKINTMKVPEDSFESTEILQVEHINNSNVFFSGEESLAVMSITSGKLEIALLPETEDPYVEKITSYERYSKIGEKNKNIYDDMSTLSEKYILHVSKSDLYK